MKIQVFPGTEEQTIEQEERPNIRIPEKQENPNFSNGGNEPEKNDPTRISPEPGKQDPGRHNPEKNDPTRITRENDPNKADPTRVQ